jgi:hypothetical protein
LSLPFRFSNQNTIRISQFSHVCYMPAHLTLPLDLSYTFPVRLLLLLVNLIYTDTESRSTGQEICHPLRKPKMHLQIQKTPPTDPKTGPFNAVHIFIKYFSQRHFNIIIPHMPSSPKWSLPVRSSQRNFVIHIFHFHMRASRLGQLISLG